MLLQKYFSIVQAQATDVGSSCLCFYEIVQVFNYGVYYDFSVSFVLCPCTLSKMKLKNGHDKYLTTKPSQ